MYKNVRIIIFKKTLTTTYQRSKVTSDGSKTDLAQKIYSNYESIVAKLFSYKYKVKSAIIMALYKLKSGILFGSRWN
jgi:hypothetical protein